MPSMVTLVRIVAGPGSQCYNAMVTQRASSDSPLQAVAATAFPTFLLLLKQRECPINPSYSTHTM